MFFNANKIIEIVKEKNRIPRILVLIFGTFLLGLAYNMYLKTNNLVTGGVTGLSIILQRLLNIDANFFVISIP